MKGTVFDEGNRIYIPRPWTDQPKEQVHVCHDARLNVSSAEMFFFSNFFFEKKGGKTCQDAYKDTCKDTYKDTYKDTCKDTYKDTYNDTYKDTHVRTYI